MVIPSIRAGKMVFEGGATNLRDRENFNPFAANVPFMEKPAARFALFILVKRYAEKCSKFTREHPC